MAILHFQKDEHRLIVEGWGVLCPTLTLTVPVSLTGRTPGPARSLKLSFRVRGHVPKTGIKYLLVASKQPLGFPTFSQLLPTASTEIYLNYSYLASTSSFSSFLRVGCFGHLKPTQEHDVVYDDYSFNPFFGVDENLVPQSGDVDCDTDNESIASSLDDEGRNSGAEGPKAARKTHSSDSRQPEKKVVRVTDRKLLDQVGVIIPCHKSGGVIQDTLKGVLHPARPDHVMVMDNGRTDLPMDETIVKVREISEDVVYKWVPVGHKGVALLLGNRLLPDTVKYVLLIDDDVQIPKTMLFDFSYFEEDNVSAVAHSIGTCGPDGRLNP